MTLLKFEYPGNTILFELGSEYPAKQPIEKYQVADRTAGGSLTSEDLGVTVRTKPLIFRFMSQENYDQLVNWFDVVVNGAENTFTLTDEYGNVEQVKIVDSVLDFEETSYQQWSGTLNLEVIT